MIDTSPVGMLWQASRVPSGAPTRWSTAISLSPGGLRFSAPSRMRTRQVEQRPRPPQTCACGTPPPVRRADPVGPAVLLVARRIEILRAVENADPAGRATPPPAADMRMRHAAKLACLQQRKAGRGQYDPVVGVVDDIQLAAAEPDQPVKAADREQGESCVHDPVARIPRPIRPLDHFRREIEAREKCGAPGGIGKLPLDLICRIDEAAEGEQRQ